MLAPAALAANGGNPPAQRIIQGIGTAPVKALQSLSERVGALMMQDAWGKSVKGPQAPLTFTCANTPFELFGPLFDLGQLHPALSIKPAELPPDLPMLPAVES